MDSRLYMSHSNPNRPNRDPHCFRFFYARDMLKCVPKKYRTRSFRFCAKFLGSISTKITSRKLKMTLLDVLDLDKVWTVRKEIL